MSQHYLLPCSCGRKIRVAPAEAGGQATCACGQRRTVPTLRGLRALEPAAPEASGKAAPGWSVAHGIIFSGGIVLVLAGIALIAFHLYRYTQLSGLTVDHTETVAAMHTAGIDQLSATQLFDEWSKIKTEGLGEKMTPPWEAAKQMVAANLFWMKAGGGAIVVGLLLSVLSLFVARPSVA
jgi:hypothetical protein